MSEKNDIMDRYIRGEFIDRQAIKDAIAEIKSKCDGGSHADEYLSGYDDGLKDALDIIRKYTGVRE